MKDDGRFQKSMRLLKRPPLEKLFTYTLLIFIALTMVYPMTWLLGSSLKQNDEIVTSLSIIPRSFDFDSYIRGWKGNGRYTYTTFFMNTIKLVFPTVLATVVSSFVVSYGFARFRFPFKKLFFLIVISTLILPQQVIMIPRYILFNRLGWLDSYKPFIIPNALATNSFFIYMLIQFIRGIPRELDESAYIDGCSSFRILTSIILPLSKPALFSVIIFQFIWRWNDFFDPLIYINSVKKFPVSLALRSNLDISDTIAWNEVMAMSVLTMIPPIIVYILAQRYLVEGISTTGLKG